MKVSDLRNDTKKLVIKWKGVSAEFDIEVEYRWRAIPFGFFTGIAEADSEERSFAYLKEVLVSWDLEDDDGNIIPIEIDAVKAALVPDWLLSEIVNAIRADMTMDGDSKND